MLFFQCNADDFQDLIRYLWGKGIRLRIILFFLPLAQIKQTNNQPAASTRWIKWNNR